MSDIQSAPAPSPEEQPGPEQDTLLSMTGSTSPPRQAARDAISAIASSRPGDSQQNNSWRSLFSSKRKEKKLGDCAGQPASRSERTPSPESSTAPMIITTTDIGRPVLVKGYGPGLLMYWGLYPKTGRPRAGVAFNRPIGLNNGTIEGLLYFRCPQHHGVLVDPVKVAFLSRDGIASAIRAGTLMDPAKVGVLPRKQFTQSPRDSGRTKPGGGGSIASSPSMQRRGSNRPTLPQKPSRPRSPAPPSPGMLRRESRRSITSDAVSISSAFSMVSLSLLQGQDDNLDAVSISSRISACDSACSRISACSSVCSDFVHIPSGIV